MGRLDEFRTRVRDQRTGMFHDLVFAVVWVTFVSVLFEFVFVEAPQWAFYLCLLAGIPAYFGLIASRELAKEWNRNE